MARLRYSAIASLDGYVVDAEGSFAWAAPDEEVHAAVNDEQRGIGTLLLGRRMYEVLRFWDEPLPPDAPAVMHDYANVWRDADKVVHSTTLDAVDGPRTTLARCFDPGAVRAMVDRSERDVSVGGPGLAGAALRAGIVDDLCLYAVPHVVGGGTSWLPAGLATALVLVDVHRFAGGVVRSRYTVAR